jgi:uncharacterized protein (DUF1697 family)
MRCVALVRGINVGGNTKVSMAELKGVFESLGFQDVRTYINSGNVGFDLEEGGGLTDQIEKAVENHFKLPIQVMTRERREVEKILANNPFAGQFESHKEMHVLFMKDEMPKEKEELLIEKQTENERFEVRGREIYCHLRLGVADSLLGKGFIEKKLKVPITARNWRTVQKLAEL